MIRVVPVETAAQRRAFIRFPLRLYRGVKEFVPPLISAEKKILLGKSGHEEDSDSIFFLAYKDGKIAGRIQGIIQRAANAKWKQARCRFTRFDCIDDQAVADALFQAVEDWARQRGMQEVVGPLGYSDLDREGLLIEGFDQVSTFEEQYNYPYYAKLIENRGYAKDVDWVERKLFPPEELDPKIEKLVARIMERNGFRILTGLNMKQIIDRYAGKFFALIDETYANLYGTVPLTDGEKQDILSDFKLLLNPNYVRLIVDRDDNLVALGLCLPSIGEAVRRSNGRLTPLSLIRIMRAAKHPKVLDLGLIGVASQHRNTGVSWAILLEVMKMLRSGQIEWCETNLNLEDNKNIQNNWDRFESVLHKRRRCYVKAL